MSTSVDTSTDVEQVRRARRDSRTVDRYAAMSVLWRITNRKRQSQCKRIGVHQGGSATLMAGGIGSARRAGFSGLATCGSVWACPCCAEKILAARTAELSEGLRTWGRQGGKVAMVTLTIKHDKGQSLVELWDAVSKAWGAATSGRAWLAAHERWGAPTERVVTRGKRKGETVTENRLGWIRLVEVTHGTNGWHVHIHCALFLRGDATGKDVDDLGCAMFQPWRSKLVDLGLAAPEARNGGLDARLWDGKEGTLASYFTKQTYTSTNERAALELSRPDLKKAKPGHLAPFQVLAKLVDAYGPVPEGIDVSERAERIERRMAIWHEWEQVSAGRRQMAWSGGLRDRLVADREQTDEELAAAVLPDGVPLCELPASTLRALAGRELTAGLLIAAQEDDEGAAALAYLDAHGLVWHEWEPIEMVDHMQPRQKRLVTKRRPA